MADMNEIDELLAEFAEEERQRLTGTRDQRKAIHAAMTAPEPEEEPAPEVVDLFSNLELPAFPLMLLPEQIRDYAADVAERTGSDPAITGTAALAVAAGALDDRIRIQPKRHDTGWTESARLWVGIIGDPSVMKTPGINAAMSPLKAIDADLRREYQAAMAEHKEACEGLKKGDERPPEPVQTRVIVSDATVEKLGDILSRQEPRGILSYQDELSGWLASMDAYKNGAGKDRSAWLEAYNGGSMAVDRISRGSIFVENWSASVLGGIQPTVIHAYAKATNHDGMLQRFILIHARPAGEDQDRAPDKAAHDQYRRLIRHLYDLQPSADPVTLSEGAHEIREALNRKITSAVRCMDNPFLTAALAKWRGLFARLLLVYHAADCAALQKYPAAVQVRPETAEQVAELMLRVLFPHAARFYQGMDHAEDSAKELAGLLLADGCERFTCKRYFNQRWKASRKLTPWEIEAVLDRLEAYGWITPEPGKLNERGRPAAYRVNPEVHSRFQAHAEAERERRAEVAAMMAELRAG